MADYIEGRELAVEFLITEGRDDEKQALVVPAAECSTDRIDVQFLAGLEGIPLEGDLSA